MFGFFDDQEDEEYQTPDELQSILDSGLDYETSSLARSIDSDLAKFKSVGIQPEEVMPRESLFMNILDTLDAPRQGVAGVVDTFFRGDMFGYDDDGQSVGTGFQRGQRENVTASDIFRRNDIIDNPILRGVAGFVADTALDPLSYLSFGTSAAAKAGGRTLAAGGIALKTEAVGRLKGVGISDFFEQEDALDEVFRAISRGQDAYANLNKASDATVKAKEAERLANAQDIYGSVFRDEEVLGKELFEKASLKVGANVPFLGHIYGGAPSLVETFVPGKDPGIVGQALRSLGKAFKPGRIDIAEVPAETLRGITEFANDKLVEVGTALTKLPVVGDPIKRTGEVLKATQDAFKKTFIRKALIGADNDALRTEYEGAIAGIKTRAANETITALGEDAVKDPEGLKTAYLLIDSFASPHIRQAEGSINRDLVDQAIRAGRLGQQASDGLVSDLRTKFQVLDPETGETVDRLFRGALEAHLADPKMDPKIAGYVRSILGHFDDAAIREGDAGVKSGLLEYYAAHRYTDLGKRLGVRDVKGKGGSVAFDKTRKLDTYTDAIDYGLTPDMNIPAMMQYRAEASYKAIANKKFFDRLVIENGLPEDVVRNLYREAVTNPDGAAAASLKRSYFDLPAADLEQRLQNQALKLKQKAGARMPSARTPREEKIIRMSQAEVANDIHTKMKAEGLSLKDELIPDHQLGELGELVETRKRPMIGENGEYVRTKSGKIKYESDNIILPKPIADAYKETIAARDLLKDKFGDSEIGRAFIKAGDAATGMFKKLVTLPFPAYWAQNFMGDRFRQLMGPLQASDPGVMARTYSLLAGNSSITNTFGQVLDKATLDRIIKENGLSFSVGDFVGTLDSFGDMNPEKILRTNKGMLDNLLSKEKGSKQALLAQTQDKFQKGFDGFFRVNEVIRRFEQGDNIQDAIRGANEMYFNYRNMTDVERSVMRRFYMFYGYTSQATRATLTDLVTNPGNITLQMRGASAVAEFFSQPDAAPTAEQIDMRLLGSAANAESLSRVIGEDADGKPIVGRGFGAPINAVMQQFPIQMPRNFTVGEMVDTAWDSATRTLQKQFAMSNPIINTAAQAISGKNLYFDKPLNAEFLRKLPSLNALAERLVGVDPSNLPVDLDAPAKAFLGATEDGKGNLVAKPGPFWVLINLIPGFSRAASTARQFSEAENPASVANLNMWTGIKNDGRDLTRSRLYDIRRTLDTEKQNSSLKLRLQNLEDDE